MKILQINTFRENKTNNKAFTSRQLYKELKNFPKISCACCGKSMILPKELQKAFEKSSRSLSIMIEKGAFEFWKPFEKVWNVLSRFAIEFPKESLDKIITSDDDRFIELKRALAQEVKAPNSKLIEKCRSIYNLDSLIVQLHNDILSRSRSHLRCAPVVIKAFEPYKKILTDQKLRTFEQLQIYARKYPDKTISEILHIDEVYKFHHMKDLLQRAETREKSDFHFDNILRMVVKNNSAAKEYFEELKSISIEKYAEGKDIQKSIYEVNNLYREALEKYGCAKLTDKVLAELEQVPKTYITTDSFLVFAKNHEMTDANIMNSLFAPYTSSFEHIIPASQDGHDSIYNGIVLCRSCNTLRDDVSYPEFLKYHPEMRPNLQKQVNMITPMLLKGDYSQGFELWPIKIAEKLYRYTNGFINLDIDKYCKDEIKKHSKIIANLEKRVNEKGTEISAKISEKIANRDKKTVLNKEIQQLVDERQDLINQIISEKSFVELFEYHLKITSKS